MAKRLRGGLEAIGRLAKGQPRVIRKGSTTTSSPSNQKSVTAKGMATMEGGRGPASPTQAQISHAQPGRPPTFQQSQQIQSEQQATAASNDTTDYGMELDKLVSGMGKPGLFQGRLRQEQKQFRAAVEAAKEGGVTRDEVEALNKQVGSEQIGGFFKGAKGFQQSTTGALTGLLERGTQGQPGAATTQTNPFQEGTVAETYRPRLEQIEQQAMTQAEQQAASEQAQKDYAQGIDQNVQDTQQRVGENIEGLQDEARGMHDQFTQERQEMSADLQEMPDRIAGKYDVALQDFTQRVDASQGIIDQKESAALSGIQRGQSQAMTAAVQGTQGQVNSQIAQINANPNLTDSQKAQMTAQVRLAGASSIGPQVGQTVLQFNQLSAQTAVAFGQMTTQIQDTGLKGAEDLLVRGAAAFENSSIAAKNIGAQLLATQENADNHYITAQANLEATRATIDMTGDTLRASLIPEMGIPYPDYANVMATGLKMDVDLMNRDFQNQMGRDMMAFQMSMMMKQANGGFFETLASIFSGIGGPVGQVGMGASMLAGSAATSNVQVPQGMTGGFTPAQGSFF